MNDSLKIYLFFDTETSGFTKESWICQFGWKLVAKDDEDPMKFFDISHGSFLIKSEGREIPEKVSDIHGITTDMCDHGIYELEFLQLFDQLLDASHVIVCHNSSFDHWMIRQTAERNDCQGLITKLESRESICTMKSTTKFCELKNKIGRAKPPRLEELHSILFGASFDDEHDAYSDVCATERCFWELKHKGVI